MFTPPLQSLLVFSNFPFSACLGLYWRIELVKAAENYHITLFGQGLVTNKKNII